MGSPLDRLKPTNDEIRELALHETRPAEARHFEPIARGPLVALVMLVGVGLIALPSMALRLLRREPEEG